jgi:hypothetical protein
VGFSAASAAMSQRENSRDSSFSHHHTLRWGYKKWCLWPVGKRRLSRSDLVIASKLTITHTGRYVANSDKNHPVAALTAVN